MLRTIHGVYHRVGNDEFRFTAAGLVPPLFGGPSCDALAVLVLVQTVTMYAVDVHVYSCFVILVAHLIENENGAKVSLAFPLSAW